jgi:hypothetical protein
VRGGKTSTARADIQTTVNTEFFLHRRKAALSPLQPMLHYARMAAIIREVKTVKNRLDFERVGGAIE